MKFLTILQVLPLAAAIDTASPAAELVVKSGKEGAQRKVFTLSKTINLAPGGGAVKGMGNGETFTITGAQLCGDCTVLEGQIHLTNAADNSPVDEKVVYNHHILTNGPRTPFPLKASGMNLAMAGGFVGAGGDNGNSPFMYYDPASPKGVITGYHMRSSTLFSTNVVLVNKSQKQQAIKVNYELEYIPGSKGENVQSALISASVIPKANGKSRSGVLVWEKPGNFIFAKGHLHDGGESMDMWFWKAGENTASAKPYYECHSVAKYENKAIVGMNPCDPVKVGKGDQVIMESSYKASLGSNAAAGGNMAMFRMIFAS
ncbi:ATP synthase subunit beta [Venturia nashicola]|uniref:ATP synthase subunit beta n=1 Tax=Venturia nashicola TaxID=86259 RepID=A0A4Z1NXF7_9PEZI|nr:ATP synthase subunit beta [Venturia nashicola]TLD27812.1 ATP synthase subunit beta [Venturia nashicola]